MASGAPILRLVAADSGRFRLYERLPAIVMRRARGVVDWDEWLHSWCRGKFHRRTKGYTQSVAMLECSLALLLAYCPAILRQFMMRIPWLGHVSLH